MIIVPVMARSNSTLLTLLVGLNPWPPKPLSQRTPTSLEPPSNILCRRSIESIDLTLAVSVPPEDPMHCDCPTEVTNSWHLRRKHHRMRVLRPVPKHRSNASIYHLAKKVHVTFKVLAEGGLLVLLCLLHVVRAILHKDNSLLVLVSQRWRAREKN